MSTSASLRSSTQDDGSDATKAYRLPRPRKFAPLKSKSALDEESSGDGLPKLRGIIFDVDGTLCLPQNYMFGQMRAALGIDKSVDILDHVRSLSAEPDQDADSSQQSSDASSPQSRAMKLVRDIESDAMTSQRPQPGLVELMTYLERRNVPKALCTRNFAGPVDHLIDTFLSDLKHGFDMIITRDTKGVQPKPSPEGLWKIASSWGIGQSRDETNLDGGADQLRQGNEGKVVDELQAAKMYLGEGIIMVGDSIDDMAAGYRAGAATVLLVNDDNQKIASHEYTEISIQRLDELTDILENGFVGRG